MKCCTVIEVEEVSQTGCHRKTRSNDFNEEELY